MARAKKAGLNLEGFEEYIRKLDELGGNVETTTRKALTVSHKEVTANLGGAMLKHNKTYSTIRTLKKESPVEWKGGVASIGVGFDISDGGLPSIFLMYGTPKMDPDKKLYNAVYGKKTKDHIREMQMNIFLEDMRSVMK